MSKQIKVTQLYAWVGIDKDGNTGILTYWTKDKIAPMIGENRETIESFRNLAFRAAKRLGSSIKLIKFSKVETIENHPVPTSTPPTLHGI